MKVMMRLCCYDRELVDGDRILSLKRGQEYTTSCDANEAGELKLFSTYWVRVPADWFCAPRPL